MAARDSQLYLAQMLDNIVGMRLWTSGHAPETYRANLMLRDLEVWRAVADDLAILRTVVQSMIDES